MEREHAFKAVGDSKRLPFLRHWAFQIGWKLVRWGGRGKAKTGVEYVTPLKTKASAGEVEVKFRA